MTRRLGLVRAWCARAWRWMLQALEVMAGLDPTGPFTGCGPPPYPVVPIGWVNWTQWADEPRAVLTEVTPTEVTWRAMTERRVSAPAEQAPLHDLRDRDQANQPPFTARELAHLHFVRWLHQTGRVIC